MKPESDDSHYKLYPQLFAAFSATILSLITGIILSWPTPVLPKLLDENSDVHLSPEEAGWVVSSMYISACLGTVISALTLNRIGRKPFMYAVTVPLILHWTLLYYAKTFKGLLAARIFGGIGTGCTATCLPVYLSEIAEKRWRGKIGMCFASFSFLGYLACYCIGYWTDIQTLPVFGGVLTLLFIMLFAQVLETPYHYMNWNMIDLARTSLMWYRGTNHVNNELVEIRSFVESRKKQRGRLGELVSGRVNRRATLILWILGTARPASGFVPLSAYISFIFRDIGLSVNENMVVIVTGVLCFVLSVMVMYLVDRLGRRLLLLTSAGGMCICLSIMGIYFHTQHQGIDVSSSWWIPAITYIAFTMLFVCGLGSVGTIVITELYPVNLKPLAVTVWSSYSFLLAGVVTKLCQTLMDTQGYHVVFYMCSSFQLVAAIAIFRFVPETMGKSFTEISNILETDSGQFEDTAVLLDN